MRVVAALAACRVTVKRGAAGSHRYTAPHGGDRQMGLETLHLGIGQAEAGPIPTRLTAAAASS